MLSGDVLRDASLWSPGASPGNRPLIGVLTAQPLPRLFGEIKDHIDLPGGGYAQRVRRLSHRDILSLGGPRRQRRGHTSRQRVRALPPYSYLHSGVIVLVPVRFTRATVKLCQHPPPCQPAHLTRGLACRTPVSLPRGDVVMVVGLAVP